MKKNSKITFITVTVLLLNLFLCDLVFAAALKNEKIKAEFNEQGLVSLYDTILDKTVQFNNDNWAIRIDGQDYTSSGLKLKNITEGKNSLIYHYSNDLFTFEVLYKLEPQWRFVSKQLSVTVADKPQFKVEQVELFNGMFKIPPSHTLIIKTAKEVFRKHHGLGDYGFFARFDSSWGAFFLVQNPFLSCDLQENAFSINYPVDMPWKSNYGPFRSDIGCIGTYKLIGTKSPSYMESHPNWTIDPERNFAANGLDLAEVDAYISCVRQFLLYHPEKPVRIHVPWCENDYQIDVSTDDGQLQWKRIVDMASELGIKNMLYTCRNDKIAVIDQAADAWHWEHLLWLNMGIDIRKNRWDPKHDELADMTRQLIDYARSKNVNMMAYVYPSLPFEQNSSWITQRFSFDKDRLAANMGFRSFQDWLIENLVEFKKRTGISGYSFDYWFLTLPGTSNYAQWYGCRRVLNELRTQQPDIVIDGRQSYHVYGPWTWLAGTYPHPTAGDEQPESFQPFPDLHFDRSSAALQRYTAYWYRNTQFCPIEIMPGFIGHQTPRANADGIAPRLENLNLRDWDYLGWKFSLFSSIATAPFSLCFNMIPARDINEFQLFSDEDKNFIRTWFDWTDKNAALLKHTRTIIGPPAIGYADGTAAIDHDHGYIFLFNSNHRKVNAQFILDQTIGLTGGEHFIIKEIYPEKDKLIGAPQKGIYDYGDTVSILTDGTSAQVLKLICLEKTPDKPLLFNVRGNAELQAQHLVLTDVTAQVGLKSDVQVLLHENRKISAVTVNDLQLPFKQQGNVVTINITFAGKYFCHAQQIGSYDPAFCGNVFKGEFSIPQRIFEQLQTRKNNWPVPWNKNDYQCTWLVPERLLLYIQIAEPDWKMNVCMKINGQYAEVKKAYSSITPGKLRLGKGNNTFTGFYVDLSDLKPNKKYQVELTIPKLKPGQFQGLFFENVENEYTEKIMP